MYNGPVAAEITDLSERCGAPELTLGARLDLRGSARESVPAGSSATRNQFTWLVRHVVEVSRSVVC
jgi:hypothetical protein